MKKPPSNNMGAETLTVSVPRQNCSLIDWLAFTFKDVTDPDVALERAGLDSLDFVPSSVGGLGYKLSKRSGNIVVYYDGNVDMGCHISMTGQGCRQFEAVGKNSDKSNQWYTFLHHLRSVGASFSRLDIAIDNVDGALNLSYLKNHIDNKQVRTRFKSGQHIKGFSFLADSPKSGETIYLGSNQSRFKVRFYDKAAERGISGVHWVRCELQCMKERAETMIDHLLKAHCDFGSVAASALNNYFVPIESNSTDKRYCNVALWWRKWIITTKKLKLTRMKAIKLVPEIIEHIKRQYSTSFAMINKYLSFHEYTAFTRELIKSGTSRMTKKHQFILESSLLPEPELCSIPF